MLFPVLAQTPVYDLLLKNGTVIDAKNKINAKRDVAIANGKIAEVAASIPAAKAAKVVDVTGLYVTPGLIDIHVHVYAGTGRKNTYCGDLSVYPDSFSFRSGVTTVVDAGTSGAKSFEDMKSRVIEISKTRVLSMLNIVNTGMCGAIEQDTSDMDVAATVAMAKKYPQIIVGVKTAHYAGPEWTAVDRAVEAGTKANIPVMVDFGSFRLERPFEELVTKRLRPGDIYTHMYLGAVPMHDEGGKIRPFMLEARKRGVIFDVGHGAGSFVWWNAAPAMKQGFAPDSISTDLHTSSMNAGMKDMLNVVSKFLNMGMTLEDAIAKSTWAPAREIKREELGHLSPGAGADIAVLRLEKGSFGFTDVNGAGLKGTQKLTAEITLRDGKVLWDLNAMTRDAWDKLPSKYKAQGSNTWDGTINATVRNRP